MKWCCALLSVLVASGCGAAESEAPPSPAPPNIVLIISDDHGYGDFGFMGSEVARTPNLDALARGGLTFTTAYNTASVCRPSLATLLTGLAPTQWDATEAAFARRRPAPRHGTLIRWLPTLPRLLGQRGYTSFQAGKHWEGNFEMAGFSQGMKRAHRAKLSDLIAWSGGNASLAIGRTTLAPVSRFIDAHRDRRFLLWFAPLLPHKPHDAPRHYLDLYTDSELSGEQRRYFANVSRLDDAVGRLVAHLERRGLRERTLIVFLADNGWETETRETGTVLTGGARGKGSMYELGWRTPLVFSWPGTIAPGRVESGLVSTLDVFPTLLDYAGIPALPRRPGHSLRPALEGGAAPLRKAVYGSDRGIRWRVPGAAGNATPPRQPVFFTRTERWRYIWNSATSEDELYDIVADPGERHDVSDRHPELAAGFRERLLAWHAELDVSVLPLED